MQIQEALFLKSSAFPDQCPDADRPEFAFIGRSNVGKSSLINMLVQKKSLAKTSATPGKTQLINHFTIRSDVGIWSTCLVMVMRNQQKPIARNGRP
jgi:GTP-binding protein